MEQKILSFLVFLFLLKKLYFINIEGFILLDINGNFLDFTNYWLTLYLGKEKVEQRYILDTTTAITSSPCSECNKCGKHLNKYYALGKGSTKIGCENKQCSLVYSNVCKSNQCSFEKKDNKEDELSGFYSQQEVYLENPEKKENNISYILPIGCTTKETGKYKKQLADGVFGLSNSPKSIISLLYNKKIITKNMFSLCFSHNGGYIALGDIYYTYHKKSKENYISYKNNIDSDKYYIKVNDIEVSNKSIHNNHRAYINSASVSTYFPTKLFEQIIQKIFNYCKEKGDICGKFKKINKLGYCAKFRNETEMIDKIKDNWPNIIIKMEGYNFIWKPENYYEGYFSDKDFVACFGFKGDSTSKNIIFGTSFMRGYDFIFDRNEQKIGFVESNCKRNNNENEIKDINKAINTPSKNLVEEYLKEGKQKETVKNWVLIIVIACGIGIFCLFLFCTICNFKKSSFNPERYISTNQVSVNQGEIM